MSDRRSNVGVSTQRRAGDAGMTLPEVLIAITVLGLITAVISSALIVTMRQASSSEGRLNVAKSEQSIGMWLPGDLASAAVISVEPDWSPCGNIEVDGEWVATGQVCPALGLPPGSNALMLGWSFKDSLGNVTYTNLSYQFYQDSDGTFAVARVECVSTGGAWTCSTIVVLKELAAPPAGTIWVPGETKPFWVIEISQPLAANATNETDLAVGETKNAKRVIVTINGGGRVSGAGGGVNRISITAGGTTRRVISGSSMVGAPSFVEARSLCGGPMTLVIDESNSIGRPESGGSTANANKVKEGVVAFINGVRGTPVKLQVIGFHTISHTLGTTQWHRYFDMANEAEVTELLAAVNTLTFDWPRSATPNSTYGGTNWEEGLFRSFYTEAGLTAEPVPNKVIFFTDGIPTFDRLVHRTGTLPADPPDPGPAWADSTGGAYSQVAFNRADFIAREFRGPIDLIGVGVGGIASGTENWVDSPRIGYRTVWYRAYRQYQRYGFQSNRDFERASGFQSNLDFERATYSSNINFQTRTSSSSSWQTATPTQYHTKTPTTNRRINGTRTSYTVTKAEYDAYRSLYGTASQWTVAWGDTTPTLFYASDVAGQGEADGWRINTGTTTWRSVTETEYETRRAAQPANWRASAWTDTTPTEYYANQPARPDRYQIGTSTSWRTVTSQEYTTYNTTTTEADGWRVNTSSSTWVTKAEYDANNTTADNSDGWWAIAAPEYVSSSSATDWVVWPGSRSGIASNELRSEEVEGIPPYDGYRPAQTVPVARTDILGRLIGDAVPPTTGTDGEYNNANVANLYTTPDWSQLPGALKAIALGDCGGTLTLQTRLNGAAAPDPFRYQATQQFDADGTELVTDKPVAYTNREQTTGNFDLAIESGLYRDVVIMPENFASLRSYQPAGWSCRAGANVKSFELVDIPNAETSPWKGIKVRVYANEAVSCTQAVTR